MQFTYDNMRYYSKSAAALCLWVRAIHKYAEIYRNVAPKLKELEQAEDEMKKVITPSVVQLKMTLHYMDKVCPVQQKQTFSKAPA